MIDFGNTANGGSYDAFRNATWDGEPLQNAHEVARNARMKDPFPTSTQCSAVYIHCPNCGLGYQTRQRAKACCDNERTGESIAMERSRQARYKANRKARTFQERIADAVRQAR